MLSNSRIKAYLLKLLTKKKSKDLDLKNIKTILFFRYDRIGDMIISTPVFRELKLANPNISISVLASKSNQEVLFNNPYIDYIYINHKNNFLSDLPTLIKLRKKMFDVCIEFDHSVIPHAILRLKIINPKKIISVRKDGRYGVSGDDLDLYDIYTEKKYQEHFCDIWLKTIEPIGIKPKSNKYDLFITESQKKQAVDFVNSYSSKFLIGVNIQGAVKNKKLDFVDLYEICKELKSHFNDLQIVILTSPLNHENISKEISKMGHDFISISYITDTILDVAALIQELDLIITPDTSITHVASTFNKPIVTIHEKNLASYYLFGPTSSLNRTVFSESKDSLEGFSIQRLVSYCIEIINKINVKKDF
jgi:ADP-heptose:LPS heptosyltransferase